jgi:hypothetical protein
MISADMTIEGLQEAQAAMNQLTTELQPRGAYGKAVQFVTVGALGYWMRIVHVDTGAYRASGRMRVELSAQPRGLVFVDQAARNPRSGKLVRDYAIVEEQRGGSHAAFARTVNEEGPRLVQQAGRILMEGLPRGRK